MDKAEQEAWNARVEAIIAEGEDASDFPVVWRGRVGAHVAEVVYEQFDSSHANPREGDQLGTMVCWHPDYILGDEQIRNMDGRGAVETAHEHSGRFRSIGMLARYCRIALNAPVVIPLYLYDHSGISMSAGPGLVLGETPKGGYDEFGSPRGWDTTLVGVIYTTPERIRELCGEPREDGQTFYCPSDWNGTPEAWIEQQLKIEVELYDRYLRGEVYGYRVMAFETPEAAEEGDTDEAEDVDSCWGYLPEVEVSDAVGLRMRGKDELHYVKFEAVDAACRYDDDRVEAAKNEAAERERAEQHGIPTVQA
jgi:hypothetical protein